MYEETDANNLPCQSPPLTKSIYLTRKSNKIERTTKPRVTTTEDADEVAVEPAADAVVVLPPFPAVGLAEEMLPAPGADAADEDAGDADEMVSALAGTIGQVKL